MQFLLEMNIVVMLLLSGILTAGYWTLGYDDGSAVISKQTSIVNQLKKAEINISEAKLDIEKIHVFDQSIKKLGQDVEIFLRYIPENLSSSNLFTDLTRAAKQKKIIVKNMVSLGLRPSGLYNTIILKLSLEGDFKQILSFLSQLTAMDKIITVNNINISPLRGQKGPQQHQSSKLNVTMDVSSYQYKRPIQKKTKSSKKEKVKKG